MILLESSTMKLCRYMIQHACSIIQHASWMNQLVRSLIQRSSSIEQLHC